MPSDPARGRNAASPVVREAGAAELPPEREQQEDDGQATATAQAGASRPAKVEPGDGSVREHDQVREVRAG